MATMAQSIRLALRHAECHLGVSNIFGQDVGPPLGGVFTLTQGLDSAWNTPLDERGIVGTGAGLAMMGQTSVCEIQFGDYFLNTLDLLRLIGNTCWSTAGQFPMPMVLMTPVGAGIHGGIYHSHSIESFLTHLPGWKVVMPSNAHDAFGLMVSSVQDGNPVAFLIPKALLRLSRCTLPGEPADLDQRINAPVGDRSQWVPEWPDIGAFSVPIGPLNVLRPGSSLTLLTYGRMVHVAEEALEGADLVGQVELCDLRTLVPYDLKAIVASVRKTGRLLVLNEDSAQTNFGEHLLRVVLEQVPDAKTRLLASRALPGVGLAQALEDFTIPGKEDVLRTIREML